MVEAAANEAATVVVPAHSVPVATSAQQILPRPGSPGTCQICSVLPGVGRAGGGRSDGSGVGGRAGAAG